MIVDDYGRTAFTDSELISFLLNGEELTSDMFAADDAIITYNALCHYNDKMAFVIPTLDPMPHSAFQEHENRQRQWFMPLSYQELDIWNILRQRCQNDSEFNRLDVEKTAYEERDLRSLLCLMMYLVDEFRRRDIVWGVGRGSSVASFTLYLIGITKINPMLYGLEITDFLKD